jgi:CheY-like chemotaxis protein/nitrogen-specific signal transduction histidine kinase/HPt (histidine-containing phosphotransfer) domain-containing protein
MLYQLQGRNESKGVNMKRLRRIKICSKKITSKLFLARGAQKGYMEQLGAALAAAERASAAKSHFMANMSHELRTPLNVIIGLSDLQLEDDGLAEDIRKNLHMVRNAGQTLLGIVNDILDISKIESGNFTLAPVKYHLASLLNDTVALVTSRIGEKPVTFLMDIREDLPSRLYGDDLRIKQILSNLLSNAIKYTHKGSVELGVHCRQVGGDVWMEITVKDTGIGIRQKDIEIIFADYLQLDLQANRKIEGTGLGLAITKKLVESMDGELSVESEYGKGSTFSLRIRQGFVADEPIGLQAVGNLRKFRYHENKRHFANTLVRDDLSFAKVLVVDDMQANLDVAASLLRKYNMQVDCVTSGQAAIERIKLEKPAYNAVFMDHMMPEMDGITAADKIRALGSEYARTIPIIALTANAILGTEDLFYEHSFQAFVTKPIDIMRLDSVINQWIKDRRSAMPPTAAPPKPPLREKRALSAPLKEKGAESGVPGLNIEKGLLNCGGALEIYQPILCSYIVDVSMILEKMQDVTAETLPSYAIAVHGIKGSSEAVGAEATKAAAANLENLAKLGDLSGVLAKNDAFIKEVECLLASIKAWLEANGTISHESGHADATALEAAHNLHDIAQ